MPEELAGTPGVSAASFQGRGLRGAETILPEGYTGVVVEKHEIGDDQTFVPVHTFDRLTYWNHDIVPSSCDTVPRCLDFLSMAELIHST